MFDSQALQTRGSTQSASSNRGRDTAEGGLKIPYDLYGHVPVHLEPYSTWVGFWMSNLVVIIFLVSSGYLFYQYATLPFDLVEADIPHDPGFIVKPTGAPVQPEVGVQFQFSNGTGYHDPEILEISFKQRYFFEGGKQGAKKLSLPIRGCQPTGAGDGLTEGRCALWANERSDVAIEAGSREEATLPEMQGVFNDETYAFIQVSVRIRLENNITDEMIQELYGGEIIMFAAYDRYELSDFQWNKLPTKTAKFFSQRFEVKKNLVSKVDIHFSMRSIERDSHMIDLSILEEESSDVVVVKVHNELDDADDEGTLIKLYFRMNDTNKRVVMVPYTTLFDIMGVIGGFLALLNFTIGVPTSYFGKISFQKYLKEAVASGTVGAEDVDGSGGVRMDKANEVVKKLDSMRSHGRRMQAMTDVVNPVLAAVQWRRAAARTASGGQTERQTSPIRVSFGSYSVDVLRDAEDMTSGESTTSVSIPDSGNCPQ